MKKLLPALAAILLPLSAYAEGDSSFGQTVTVEPSVRANALGDAYSAADGDTFGFFYNPAQHAPASVGATYQRGYADNDGTGVFAAALPNALSSGLDMGLGFTYYNAGDMTMYSSAGTADTFNAEKDWMVSLNASRALGEHWRVGATAKDVHLSLFDSVSGNAMVFDGGVLAQYPLLNFGFAVRNVGQRLQLGTEDENFPSDWRAGVSREFAIGGGNSVSANADYVKYTDLDPSVRIGGEFAYMKLLAFRLGYQFASADADANTLLYGFGVKIKSFALDYAMVPYLSLGTTHRVSLTYKFGSKGSEEAAPVAASEQIVAQAMQAEQPKPVAQPAVAAQPAKTEPQPVPQPAAVQPTPAPQPEAQAATPAPATPAAQATPAPAPQAAEPVATVTPAPAPEASNVSTGKTSSNGVKIETMVITDAINAKQPAAPRTDFKADERAYCWILIMGKAGDNVQSVWYRDNAKVMTVPLEIKYNHMRTWSYKSHLQPGEWRVDMVDADGTILGTGEFTVK
jgi:hypothetical protein